MTPTPAGTRSMTPTPAGTRSMTSTPAGTRSMTSTPAGTRSMTPTPAGTRSMTPTPAVTLRGDSQQGTDPRVQGTVPLQPAEDPTGASQLCSPSFSGQHACPAAPGCLLADSQVLVLVVCPHLALKVASCCCCCHCLQADQQ